MTSIPAPAQQDEFYSVKIGERQVSYYLRPAQEPGKPILFILHGHGFGAQPSQFRGPNWNVVCPMDHFGEHNFGSWYLGEQGDFFWLEAMKQIIAEARQRAGTGRLYFWGSSMGGYAAILHGYMNQATAVYANVPQTVLLGSHYSNSGMKQYFQPIFSDKQDSLYNDLKKVITTRSRTKYFLCFNQMEGSGRYFDEQGLPFVTHLHRLRQKMYLEVRPTDAHGKNHGVSEAIALFNKFNE